MANKRMFSLDIVASDAFLDMPISSQALYFQLGMYADDEGFVNPKKIMRMIGTGADDLKVLIGKRFVLPFKSGVVVIKHWLIHNTIRMDRFAPTTYQEEKNNLFIKENKAYTDLATSGKPVGNQMVPQEKRSQVKLRQVKLSQVKTILTKVRVKPQYGKTEINQLLEFGYTLGFATTKQTLNRYCINRLLKGKSAEQLKKAAEVSQQIRNEPYAPQINNWLDLEDKYLKLRDFFVRQQKSKEQPKKGYLVL